MWEEGSRFIRIGEPIKLYGWLLGEFERGEMCENEGRVGIYKTYNDVENTRNAIAEMKMKTHM